MDRVFEEDGVTYTQKYQSMLDDACRKYDRTFFEGKLQEADTYFEEAAKRGWPSIKSFQDLQVECHRVPFIRRCLNQLDALGNGGDNEAKKEVCDHEWRHYKQYGGTVGCTCTKCGLERY